MNGSHAVTKKSVFKYCFLQLMYWIIYNHLSDDETLDGLIFFNSKELIL